MRYPRALLVMCLLAGALSSVVFTQTEIRPASSVNGAGVSTGSLTIPAGYGLMIRMSDPAAPTMTQNQSGTDIAAGVYQTALVGVDPAGGLTLPSATQAVTVGAGGAGRIVFTYTAPTGSVSVRAYVSLAAGAVPDRYFSCTASPCNVGTLTGATVAALPTSSTAYRSSVGGTLNWFEAANNYFSGNVGIGTTGPISKLDIVGTKNTSLLSLRSSSNPSTTGDYVGIDFGTGNYTDGTLVNRSSRILGFTDGANDAIGLSFYTSTSNSAAPTEKVRIDKTGNVGIGTTAPDRLLTVAAAGGIGWLGRSYIGSSADGVVSLFNNAGTGFTRQTFGPATSLFPALSVTTAATPTLTVIAGDGSGASNLSVTGTLTVSGAGPHAIGTTTSPLYGINARPTVTPTAANTAGGMLLYSTINEAGSDTHPILFGLCVSAPLINAGAATVTNTATIYIDAAPTATVTGANYALWVDAGNARFDADVSAATFTAPGGAGVDCTSALAVTVSKGIVTACSQPEATPAQLLQMINDLRAELAAMRAEIAALKARQ